ncbi:MAG TPA: hypothetical protein VG367_20535 [Mucilaginibacter sp.]|jgi:hypothetical protein|nr:hypothetical protein [Mucilaginibacter sp.]
MTTRKPLNNLLRTITMLALLAGAMLSAMLTLHAGRKNASVILPAMFIIWVVSPFAWLLFAQFRFKRSIYKAHCLFIILLCILSVIAYNGVPALANVKPAAVFLFTPLVSWGIIVIAVALIKRSRSE